jgi:hypothetical protein
MDGKKNRQNTPDQMEDQKTFIEGSGLEGQLGKGSEQQGQRSSQASKRGQQSESSSRQQSQSGESGPVNPEGSRP